MTKVRTAANVARSNEETATAMSKVKSLLKVVTPEKAMRVFNRTKNDNVKLDKFLSGNFTLPKAFQPEQINAQIDGLINPKKHEHHGLINIQQQKDLLAVICKELVGLEVANKTEWLGSFALSEEQQLTSAKALQLYENTLNAGIKTVASWKKVYGE